MHEGSHSASVDYSKVPEHHQANVKYGRVWRWLMTAFATRHPAPQSLSMPQAWHTTFRDLGQRTEARSGMQKSATNSRPLDIGHEDAVPSRECS